MPLLQVRACPEDIYRKVALAAKRQNRTIAQEVVVLLQKGLGQEESNIERRKQILDKITGHSIPHEVNAIDRVNVIREAWDR